MKPKCSGTGVVALACQQPSSQGPLPAEPALGRRHRKQATLSSKERSSREFWRQPSLHASIFPAGIRAAGPDETAGPGTLRARPVTDHVSTSAVVALSPRSSVMIRDEAGLP